MDINTIYKRLLHIEGIINDLIATIGRKQQASGGGGENRAFLGNLLALLKRIFRAGFVWAGQFVDIDHGRVLGLADDDHLQYALLAGRQGGQALTGGTAAGDDLTLKTTSNTTKGSYILYDLQNAGHLMLDADKAIYVDTETPCKVYSQQSEPTLTDGHLALWHDTVGGGYYLVAKISGSLKKVQLT